MNFADNFGEWLSFGQLVPQRHEWTVLPLAISEPISALRIEFSLVGNGKFSDVRTFGWLRPIYSNGVSVDVKGPSRRVYPSERILVIPFTPYVPYDSLGLEVFKKFRRYPGFDWLWELSVYGLKGEGGFQGGVIPLPQQSTENNLIF